MGTFISIFRSGRPVFVLTVQLECCKVSLLTTDITDGLNCLFFFKHYTSKASRVNIEDFTALF